MREKIILRMIGVRMVLFAILLAATSSPAIAQEPLLWGSLKPGPHAVGYRMLYQFDHSREYDPEYIADPAKPTVHRPRPILICAWYPARKTDGAPMAYREYLDVSSNDPRLASFVKRLKHHADSTICDEIMGKPQTRLSSAEASAFERFLATKTLAVKDARAADGRFPVVIYHPGLGGTFEDNSVLFELLASHGYVVLSSAYPSSDASSVGIDGELPNSFRDMEFLCRFAHDLPFADADRLAAMGHSFGAIAALAWAALPNSPLRAFITLDSGLEYGAVEDTGSESLIRHMQTTKGNIRAASLRFASRERKANFEFLDAYLKSAPRYGAMVSSLTHNDYLTQGQLRVALDPKSSPEAKKAKRVSYDRLCVHVLHFLGAILKQEATARDALQRSIRGEGLDERFQLQFKAAVPAPPTNRQLAQYVRRHGAEKTAALLRSFPNEPRGKLSAAPFVLLNDGDAKAALPVLKLCAREFPEMADIQAMLGQALSQTGDREGAIKAFHKAAELLPADKSVGGLGPYWKYVIKRGLKELGHPETAAKSR